ncbi:MAG: hypothetical protein WB622_04555 [Acidobacteriaceae bacterium]
MRFRWVTYDVNYLLPLHWQQDIAAVAREADCRDFPRTPLLSREAPDVRSIRRGRVHADQVRDRLPWLHALYAGTFRNMAEDACGEAVVTAQDHRYSVVLNIQRGQSMRFESHVDSNPLSGLLFLTDHPTGGGELAIAHDSAASDVAAVDRACTTIWPHAGHMIFFDGRRRAHYARPLKAGSDLRVVAVMNYYTASSPESTRSRVLNHHLYGDPL